MAPGTFKAERQARRRKARPGTAPLSKDDDQWCPQEISVPSDRHGAASSRRLWGSPSSLTQRFCSAQSNLGLCLSPTRSPNRSGRHSPVVFDSPTSSDLGNYNEHAAEHCFPRGGNSPADTAPTAVFPVRRPPLEAMEDTCSSPRTELSNAYEEFKRADSSAESIAARRKVLKARERVLHTAAEVAESASSGIFLTACTADVDHSHVYAKTPPPPPSTRVQLLSPLEQLIARGASSTAVTQAANSPGGTRGSEFSQIDDFLAKDELTVAFEKYVHRKGKSRSPIGHLRQKVPSIGRAPPLVPPPPRDDIWASVNRQACDALRALSLRAERCGLGAVLGVSSAGPDQLVDRAELQSVLTAMGMTTHLKALVDMVAPSGGTIRLHTLQWAIDNHKQLLVAARSLEPYVDAVEAAKRRTNTIEAKHPMHDLEDRSVLGAIARAQEVLYPPSPRSRRPMGNGGESAIERARRTGAKATVHITQGRRSSFGVRQCDITMHLREKQQEEIAAEMGGELMLVRRVHDVLCQSAVREDRINLHCMRRSARQLGLNAAGCAHVFEKSAPDSDETMDLNTTCSVVQLTKIVAALKSTNRAVVAKALFELIDDDSGLLSFAELSSFVYLIGGQQKQDKVNMGQPKLVGNVLAVERTVSMQAARTVCFFFKHPGLECDVDGLLSIDHFVRAAENDDAVWNAIRILMDCCKLRAWGSKD